MNPILLAAVGGVCLAVQFTLNTRYWRDPGTGLGPLANGLLINSIKGLSFALWLVPLVALGVFSTTPLTSDALSWIVLAAVISGFGDWASSRACQLCKVGVIMAAFQGCVTITALLCGMVFFDERLTWLQLLGIAGLAACVYLVTTKERLDVGERAVRKRAVEIAILGGVLCGLGNVCFGFATKLLGFCGATIGWQSGIGVFACLALATGRATGRIEERVLPALRFSLVWRIALITLPCVLGVLMFARAQQIGDIGVTNVVINSTVNISVSVLGTIILKERLHRSQWLGLVASCACLWLLRS